MREILFRGKDIDNPGWIYGFLSVSGDENPSTVIDYQIKNMNCYGQVEVDPETVGQFTGLTDKNGNRAFEHDVIKHHFGDEIGVIRYGEYRNPFGDDNFGGHVGFYVDWVCGEAPGALRKDLGYWVRIAVILGNIHDTPELLGGEGDGN